MSANITYQTKANAIDELPCQIKHKGKFWIIDKLERQIKQIMICLKSRILSFYYDDPKQERLIILNDFETKITLLENDSPFEYSLLLIRNNKILLEMCHHDLNILKSWRDILTVQAKNSSFSKNYTILADIYKIDGSHIAKVKEISTSNIYVAKFLTAKKPKDKSSVMKIMNEIAIMRNLNHPNIVKLHEVYEENHNFIVVMEYVPGGDVLKRLNQKGPFTEEKSAKLIINLLNILIYLQERDIIHKDIKPPNILLCSENDDTTIKLTDFGYSSKLYWKNVDELCGTLGFFAPELFRDKKITHKVDIYCSGLMLYVLLTGKAPFQGKETESMLNINKIGVLTMTGFPWHRISTQCKELISLMTSINPSERPSAVEALNHPWLVKYSTKEKNLQLRHESEEIPEISFFSTFNYDDIPLGLKPKSLKPSFQQNYELKFNSFMYVSQGDVNKLITSDIEYKKNLLKEEDNDLNVITKTMYMNGSSIFQRISMADSKFNHNIITTTAAIATSTAVINPSRFSLGVNNPRSLSKLKKIEEILPINKSYDIGSSHYHIMVGNHEKVEEYDYSHELNEFLPNLEGYINKITFINPAYNQQNMINTSRQIIMRSTSGSHESQCYKIDIKKV